MAGTAFLSFGTALQQAAGFGMSMVVAPAYVLADWVGFIPAGTMCYLFQGFLILLTSLLLLGQLRFIGVGTFIITAVNGPLISLYGRFLEKRLDFSALLPGLQRLFAGEEEETMKGESL